MEFKVYERDDMISICVASNCDYLDGFLDIWIDADGFPSPFKTIDEAKAFAEILIKLMRTVKND